MAPVKRRPRARSQHKMKPYRRKPNIPELVYKFLSLGCREGKERASNVAYTKCSFCKRQKRRSEVLDSLNSPTTGGNMANKRRDSKKNSKIHHVRRRRSAREPTMSACMHSRSRGEGLRKMKRYIQKALDFGVESGYLIPKDAAYRVLRVSSDLMNDGNYMSKVKHSARGVSQDRDKTPRQTPIRFEEYEVQDARRRRSGRRRRRSRSGSRRRRRSRKRARRRRRSDTDEIVENDDDYEFDNPDENRRNTENAVREDETERKASNDEKTTGKSGEGGSDLSVDEEESDEDEEKKGNDETQS